jgi:hypothetical protein
MGVALAQAWTCLHSGEDTRLRPIGRACQVSGSAVRPVGMARPGTLYIRRFLACAFLNNINQIVRLFVEALAGLTKRTGSHAASAVRSLASPSAAIPGARGTTGRAPNATPPSLSALGARRARALAGLRHPAFDRDPDRQRLDHLISAIVSPNAAYGE